MPLKYSSIANINEISQFSNKQNREMSIFKKRIIEYLDSKGVKKSTFYKDTGVANGVLSQKSGLSEDNILRFLSFYKDVNPTWFFTGRGEMFVSQADASKEKVVPTKQTTNVENDKIIDLLNDKITLLEEQKVMQKKANDQLKEVSRLEKEISNLERKINKLERENEHLKKEYQSKSSCKCVPQHRAKLKQET
jgi:hypothetical protein